MDKNNQLDLNSLVQSQKYKFTLESCLDEHEDDGKLRRRKDWFLFISMLVSLSIVFCVSIVLIFTNKNMASVAFNGMIGLASALAGYYVGGKNR